MKLQDRIGLTNNSSRWPKAHNHDIVSNQTMSTLNKVKSNLTFADATLTHQQNPGAMNVKQNPMNRGFGVDKILKISIDCIKNSRYRKSALK